MRKSTTENEPKLSIRAPFVPPSAQGHISAQKAAQNGKSVHLLCLQAHRGISLLRKRPQWQKLTLQTCRGKGLLACLLFLCYFVGRNLLKMQKCIERTYTASGTETTLCNVEQGANPSRKTSQNYPSVHLLSLRAVSYTHLTLPTICSV